jgi:hypothetical protein
LLSFKFCSSLTLSFILTNLSISAWAQTPPVPGVAEGAVDGTPFSVPLDCSSWQNEVQRQARSAGDDRRMSDENGDGYVFSFSYLVPADRGDGTLIIDGRELRINPGFRPGPDAPKWKVGEDSASFSGPTVGQDSAEIDVTIDCAPREASARGFTGRVTGTIDGKTIDEALFCGGWDDASSIGARTDEGEAVSAELFVRRDTGHGTIEIEAEGELYQIVAAPLAGTEFEITGDSVRFAEELKSRQSGETYTVDLTFDCKDR